MSLPGHAHEAYVALVVAAEEARTAAEESARGVNAAITGELAVERFVAASREANRAAEAAATGRVRRAAASSGTRGAEAVARSSGPAG